MRFVVIYICYFRLHRTYKIIIKLYTPVAVIQTSLLPNVLSVRVAIQRIIRDAVSTKTSKRFRKPILNKRVTQDNIIIGHTNNVNIN